ncbi:MAG: hypothetical protein QOG54_834 [Actinomycetota bacterium]|nr:hypothetical protein [Actinomycetota bacterium]
MPTGWSVEVAAGSVLLGHEEGSVTLLEPIALYPLKPDGSAATPQPGGSSQSFLLGRADLVDHENTFTPARLGEFPAGSLDATVRSIAGGQTPLFETEGTTITIEDGPIRIYVANASGKTLVALIQAPQASFSSFANEAESLLDTVNGL